MHLSPRLLYTRSLLISIKNYNYYSWQKKPSLPRFFLLQILWWLAQLGECRSTEWEAISLNLSWTTNQGLKKPGEIMQAVIKTYSQFRWLHHWVVKLTLGLVSFTLTNQLEGGIKEVVTLFRKSGVCQWGTQSSRLWDKVGTVSKKIISTLWASVWSKNKGGLAPRAPPLNLLLYKGPSVMV